MLTGPGLAKYDEYFSQRQPERLCEKQIVWPTVVAAAADAKEAATAEARSWIADVTAKPPRPHGLPFPFHMHDVSCDRSILLHFAFPKANLMDVMGDLQNFQPLVLKSDPAEFRKHFQSVFEFAPQDYHLLPLVVDLVRFDTHGISLPFTVKAGM